MTPVDSPPQVAPLDVRVMGVVVRIAAEDAETRDRLARQWSRARVETTDDDPAVTLTVAPSVPASEAASDYLLTTRVTLAGLTATAGRRLNLHAGGLADDRGRVLALVAASGTGKTTATRVLAQRLGYVSDETVSVDPDGTVTPHPKPLSVVTDPRRPMDKEQLSPDDLGLVPTPAAGRLARLVVLHRDPEAPRGLVLLGALRGMLDLIEQSSSLAQLAGPPAHAAVPGRRVRRGLVAGLRGDRRRGGRPGGAAGRGGATGTAARDRVAPGRQRECGHGR